MEPPIIFERYFKMTKTCVNGGAEKPFGRLVELKGSLGQ